MDIITDLDLSKRPFTARGDSGTTYTADAVILATGARAKWLGLPSEEKFKGFGVSACATCDGFFYRGQEIVVVGGGNTAVEEALFLTNFASKVTLVHRRDELRAEMILQDRLCNHPKIETLWFHEVEEVIGTEAPLGVEGVRVRHVKTGEITTIPAKGVFVAIGHAPASELVKDSLELHHGGYVKVQPGSTATSDARRVCRRRPDRPHLSSGRDQRRDGLHGRARRRALAGGARLGSNPSSRAPCGHRRAGRTSWSARRNARWGYRPPRRVRPVAG